MGEQTIAELYAEQGWYLSPRSEHYEPDLQAAAYDEEEARDVAQAIYGLGVDVDEVNIPLSAMKVPVPDAVVQLVTELDGQAICPFLVPHDEITELEFQQLEHWSTDIGMNYDGVDTSLLGGSGGGGGGFVAAAGAAASAALLAMIPMMVAAGVGYLSHLTMKWLSDKISIGGDERALENAIYYGGRLIGYTGTGGEVYGKGHTRIVGKEI